MNPEFEAVARQGMLSAVQRKHGRRRKLRICLFGAMLIALLQSLIYLSLNDAEPQLAASKLTHEVKIERTLSAHAVIETQAGYYQLIDSTVKSYVIIEQDANRQYMQISRKELLASLPRGTAIRIGPNGSVTLLE